MEAGEVALYMFFACAFATLLQHPASPVRNAIMADLARRALMGLAMGTTVIIIVISPWGKQSGGHFNPAITFTFYRLGKVAPWDATFYVIAQFCGAVGGHYISSNKDVAARDFPVEVCLFTWRPGARGNRAAGTNQ